MGRPQKYYFKWGLFDNNFQGQIVEHFSRLWAFNLGPNVVAGWGWTSDRLANGRDEVIGWLDTGPNATKALAGGAKKMILATPFESHLRPVFAKSKAFRMLSIRIAPGPDAPTKLLLNFSDIEVLDFTKTGNFGAVHVKVHDPTVDVFTGVESSGPLDHSKQKADAARTLRFMEAMEDLSKLAP